MTRYRWVIVARGCVIVTLAGAESIHIGTRAYIFTGIALVAIGVGLGAYAFHQARHSI